MTQTVESRLEQQTITPHHTIDVCEFYQRMDSAGAHDPCVDVEILPDYQFRISDVKFPHNEEQAYQRIMGSGAVAASLETRLAS
jgi:hypothetical protein